MFVDLPPGYPHYTVMGEALRKVLGGPDTERISQGHYLAHLNFGNDIRELIRTQYPSCPWIDSNLPRPSMETVIQVTLEDPPDYGVCDSPEQVVERFPQLVADERPLLVYFTEVRREDQSPEGGWRWHKWGVYIGEREPTTEYLYDEPEIESVYVFHIVQLHDRYRPRP